jgi:hypothetical protein
MHDYEGSTTVGVPRDGLFEYLSRIENLPKYMARMTEAHSLAGDVVSVEARVEPGDVGAEDVGPDDAGPGRTVRTAAGSSGGLRARTTTTANWRSTSTPTTRTDRASSSGSIAGMKTPRASREASARRSRTSSGSRRPT